MEHNFRATIGRDNERKDKARRISWADQNSLVDEEEEMEKRNVSRLSRSPTYVTIGFSFLFLDSRMKRIEALLMGNHSRQQRARSPPPPRAENKGNPPKCYYCGEGGHFARDCRPRSRSPQAETPQAIKITHLEHVDRGIIIPVKISGVDTSAVVNTGADATVISREKAAAAGIPLETGRPCK